MFIITRIEHGGPRPNSRNIVRLVRVHVLFFVFQCLVGNSATYSGGVIPEELSSGIDLVGALNFQIGNDQFTQVHYAAPLTIYGNLFLAIFLHGGVLHLVFNMMFLLVFGPLVENRLKPTRFLLLYFAAGACGFLAHALSDPSSTIPTVGASGSVFGVLAAYSVLFPSDRLQGFLMFVLPFRCSAPLFAFTLCGLELLNATSGSSFIAHWAHVGGFLAGTVFAYLWKKRASIPSPETSRSLEPPHT